MGKIFTFQSPLHGQCGTTATMVAVAYAMKLTGKSIVLVHSQSKFADLENLFYLNSEKQSAYSGIGLDGLCYTIKARDLERSDLERAMLQLDEGFYLLPSAAKRVDAEREEILNYIISEKLPTFYDYVFVDIGSGYSEIADKIRKIADTNFIVISQNRQVLDYVDTKELSPKTTVLVCGDYDKNRKLNLNSLRQYYPRYKTFAIPHCSEYGDAITDSRVHQFFHGYEYLLDDKKKKKLFSMKAVENTEQFFQYLQTAHKTLLSIENRSPATADTQGGDDT